MAPSIKEANDIVVNGTGRIYFAQFSMDQLNALS
jgi:hypothetical protein